MDFKSLFLNPATNMSKNLEPVTNENDATVSQDVDATDALPDFGMEVNEVEFKEFDRRNKPKNEDLPTGFERRGFLGEVDRLIRDLGYKSSKH